MLTSQVQSSLDQLLYVVKNAISDEKLDFYYIFECKGALKNVSKNPILHITAKHSRVIFKILYESDLKHQENSSQNIILLSIDDMSYECLQAFHILCIRGTSRSISGAISTRYRYYFDFQDRISELFLYIIHRECTQSSRLTAEKVIALGYPVFQAVLLGNSDVVEHMITLGCPVDDRSLDKNYTALHRAIQCMDLEMVKALVRQNSNVDLADSNGLLPIARYGSFDSNNFEQPEIIEILLNKSVLLKDMQGENLLSQLRAPFTYGNKEVIRMLLKYRNNLLSMRDADGQTPLHYLSENRHSDITEALRGYKIDVDVRHSDNCTPLFLAAYSGNHINTIKFLLENGADVNARTEYNFASVPLFALCHRSGSNEGIETLLEYNVDIQFVGPNQETVFDVIERYEMFNRAKPLIAQLVILKEEGIPITQNIFNKINSNEKFRKYFELCRVELTNIKNNSINQSLSLYKILFNCEGKILKKYRGFLSSLSQLENLKKGCHSDHTYYATINKRICNIAISIELYQKAAPVLCELSKLRIDANHLIILEIANYLDDQDLQTLVEMSVEYV